MIFNNLLSANFLAKFLPCKLIGEVNIKNCIRFSNALASFTLFLAHMHINKMARPKESIDTLSMLASHFLLMPVCH
jgi:hypothetical protein